MTTHPYDHTDEWRTAQYRDPATNRDDRPDPSDYQGINSGPVHAVPSSHDDVLAGMRWGDPICPSCQRNELRFWDDPICGECAEDRLAEEAHDRGRAGEWHR